ncbi:MAG: GNAT family N-acetyltransferase [Salinigranum sp.]
MRIEEIGLSTWRENVPKSGFTPFHLPEALEVIDSHFDGEMRLYGGFKGQELVSMLPLFVRERVVGRAVFSPPPGLGVPRLGPVLMPTSPKRRKKEKVNREFTEAVLSELDLDDRLTLFRMICPPAYADPRPYRWSDLDVETLFTYRLSVGSRSVDDVLSTFSRSLRREMKKRDDLDVTVSEEGLDAARYVYDITANRYGEQEETLSADYRFVYDVGEALGDRFRVYVVRNADGEFLSGLAVLFSNDAAYYWLGGAKTVHRNVSVNNFLHLRVIEDIAAGVPVESVDSYDLVGANTERLCSYKAKFGGDLVPYYAVETGGVGMDVAKAVYRYAR